MPDVPCSYDSEAEPVEMELYRLTTLIGPESLNNSRKSR